MNDPRLSVYPKRYLVAFLGYEEVYVRSDEADDSEEPLLVDTVGLHGGLHPTAFKTYRNAVKAAAEWGNADVDGNQDRGVVLLLDLTCLPVVDSEDVGAVKIDNACEDMAFAERQMILWAQRCERLSKERR